MRRILGTTVVLSIVWLLAAPPAQAQDMDPLRVLLLAEQPPSTQALARLCDDPVAALIALVENEDEVMLVRRRAVFMLGHYGGHADVEPFLLGLLRTSRQGVLRRASASSLSRLLGSTDPGRFVEQLEPMLVSTDPFDREMAVMLLGRLTTPLAHQRLSRLRIIERHRAVVDALRRAFTEIEQR